MQTTRFLDFLSGGGGGHLQSYVWLPGDADSPDGAAAPTLSEFMAGGLGQDKVARDLADNLELNDDNAGPRARLYGPGEGWVALLGAA